MQSFPSFAAAAAAADAMAAVALKPLGPTPIPFSFSSSASSITSQYGFLLLTTVSPAREYPWGDSINDHQSFPSFTGGMQALKINAQLIVCSEYIDREREREICGQR